MKEHPKVRQIPGERRRRWFSSELFDLIVWLEDDGTLAAFELCYDKHQAERSLIWRAPGEFAHMAVDDGERRPGKYKGSPVLVQDGSPDVRRIYPAFVEAARELPADIATGVTRALESHPHAPSPA
jgi:hypothetical protein